MTSRLTGRIAVVTGSDSGIGAATAVRFAKEGADVAVTYHSDEKGAHETLAQVEDEGQRGLVHELDQRDPENVEALFDAVQDELGTPDLLVNNAGIPAAETPVAEMDIETWDRAIETNLSGPFYCSREFLQRLDGAPGPGDIINISSIHEEVPRPGWADYDAAKSGLLGLTRTLALELAEDRVNVNSIAPGMILTPFNEEAQEDPEARREQEENIPMKRAGEPDEVAKAAVYLASEDADYVQGITLTIDGGLRHLLAQGA